MNWFCEARVGLDGQVRFYEGVKLSEEIKQAVETNVYVRDEVYERLHRGVLVGRA